MKGEKMKKIIVAILVAVVLAGLIGGAVYAVGGHQPIRGQKLVGMCPVGTAEITDERYDTVLLLSNFNVTNPDCAKSIAIERLQVIDEDGTVVFAEGPGTYEPTPGKFIDIPAALLPHQVWKVLLQHITGIPGTFELFTVEIEWKGGKKYPLIGKVTKGVHGIKVTPNLPNPPTIETHVLGRSSTLMVSLPLK